jgi:hypothetical protein
MSESWYGDLVEGKAERCADVVIKTFSDDQILAIDGDLAAIEAYEKELRLRLCRSFPAVYAGFRIRR